MKTRKHLAKYFAEQGFNLGAEIGVLGGGYSVVLCQANPKLKLYAIDSWSLDEGRRQDYHTRKYEEAKTRLAPFNVTLIEKYSLEAAKDFEDNSLDFVFIDANHSFDAVIQDLITWKQKVRKGGIVAGDDYNTSQDVKTAVNAYTASHKLQLQLTTELDYRGVISWYFKKRWNS
jgi:predicted O-methyltransferase YrrM